MSGKTIAGKAHTHVEAKPGPAGAEADGVERASDRGAEIIAARIAAEGAWGSDPQRVLVAILADLMAASAEDSALSFEAALASARRD